MTLPLIVRPLAASEESMLLAAWKKDLYDERFRMRWGRWLDGECFWLLVNDVLERVSLPSSHVLVGCYETEPHLPLCWMVIRAAKRVPRLHDVLYMSTRHEIHKDPPLAAALQREFLAVVERTHPLAPRAPFNPFQELGRQ